MSPEFRELLRDAADAGVTPLQAHAALSAKVSADRVPDLRSFQRAMAREQDEPWRLGDRASNAGFLLEVLGTVVRKTQGYTSRLSQSEARWLDKIASVAPEIDRWTAYRLARAYVDREARSASVEALDLYLALRGWEPNGRVEYDNLVQGGLPSWFPMGPTVGEMGGLVEALRSMDEPLERSPVAWALESLLRAWPDLVNAEGDTEGE
jgi:hypothetical protein